MWSRSGRELFFLTADHRMAVVAVQPGAAFAYGKQQQLFDATGYFELATSRVFDVSADGKRFLMLKSAQAANAAERPRIVVVQNWFEEIEQKMAGGKK